MSKAKKHRKGRIFFMLILAVLIIVPIVKAQLNYGTNATIAESFMVVDAEGYVQNQDATQVFSYGFNTSDRSGCGWIATYNVLNYLYRNGLTLEEPSIADVIKPLDMFGTFGFGFLGTNPVAMKLFLDSKGLQTSLVLNQDKFYESAKNADINIMLYFSKKFNYGHYQLMEYNEGTDDFTFYTPSYPMSMDTYLENHASEYVILLTIHA